jgi:hypothetical protein
MIPVIESTEIDKSRIDLAGADWEAKMLVFGWMRELGHRLRRQRKRDNIASALTARTTIELVVGRICLKLVYVITRVSVQR